MLSDHIISHLQQQISQIQGHAASLTDAVPVAGGDINQAYRLHGTPKDYFVKLNQVHFQAMFAAEAKGLKELVATATVRVPEALCCGVVEGQAYLVLEYLPLAGRVSGSERWLGQQLALLHAIEQPGFGWHLDNSIGSTPQPNPFYQDWVAFWREQRLGFQLKLAKAQGYGGKLQDSGQRLLEQLPVFFQDYRPQSALLHGDLWSGNQACLADGTPVIFDPACYYGDHEADLAMMELFGRPGADFYAAYREHLAIDAGFKIRKTLYNLYHILNHLNLFGSGYQYQAERMIDLLLAEA
ncbi:MAG: fructosamine kinase family protein [Methylococcales bacterium]|nr:fructosamine kinase family protein [Methylococcales bacterium]